MQQKWLIPLVIVLVIGCVGYYFYARFAVAPDLVLKDLQVVGLDKNPVDLGVFDGKKRIVCFAASWCGPCHEELKLIAALKQNQLAGVEILVISDESVEDVQAFQSLYSSSFTWLKLTKRFADIGIHSVPTSYILNTRGRVMKKAVGYVDWKNPATAHHLLQLMN